MSPLEVGYEVDVIDEQLPVSAPTATDTCFLLHSAAAGEPDLQEVNSAQDARDAFPATAAIHTNADAFFGEGGGRLYVSKLAAVPVVADTLARFTPDHGPGQVVAPGVVTGPELNTIAEWCWTNNRIAILNGPDGANDAALIALANAVIAGTGGRVAELEADTLLIPGLASGTTREVSAAIVKAALIARSDIATGNPNLAAAGIAQGRCRYAIGMKVDRTDASRQALAAAQINTFKNVYGTALSAYGYLSLADLDTHAHWWDLSGARTVMAARAREAAVAERHMFGQVDGEGQFLGRYEGGLRGELADLARIGALFGNDVSPAYRVDVSEVVNPLAELAEGIVTATLTLRTSPHMRRALVHIIKRPITQEV
ncbi:MAG TPA: hypothetical protein VGJ32_16550 [Solirubrobacteraceae bacterium]